jgi:hypothetical protein
VLLVSLWPTIVHCSITTTGEDDGDAMDTVTRQQQPYYRPYSLNLGVPQNLNGLNEKVMNDDDNQEEEAEEEEEDNSKTVMEDYMDKTEEYFRDEVLNVLKPEQVERCKDYHEHCVVWRLVKMNA